jgi:hypothetical protein
MAPLGFPQTGVLKAPYGVLEAPWLSDIIGIIGRSWRSQHTAFSVPLIDSLESILGLLKSLKIRALDATSLIVVEVKVESFLVSWGGGLFQTNFLKKKKDLKKMHLKIYFLAFTKREITVP